MTTKSHKPPSVVDVLTTVRGAAQRNQLHYSRHVQLESMPKRGVQARDVKSAIMTAQLAEWQEAHKSWKLTGGTDFDGEQLAVAVTVEGTSVLVVTVF